MRNSINPPKIHREISFSQPFQYQNDYDKSIFHSPSIAVEERIQSISKNKDRHRYESPLRNLHYKYLPSSKKVAELESQSTRQMEMLKKREESNQKIENFCEINKRIKKLLVEIKGQENRKSYFCEKFSIQMPQDYQASPNYYVQSNNLKRNTPQECENYQYFFNNRNNFKKQYSRQKQNQYLTPTRNSYNINQYNCSKVSNFELGNAQKSPLTEKKINRNHDSSKKFDEISRSNSSMLKKSVYANLTQKRNRSNKENAEIIIKGKNVEEEMQKLQDKIQKLQKMKKQLQIELPSDKFAQQQQIFESHLTKNSSIIYFQPKESSIMNNQNYSSSDSHLLSIQSKYQEKDMIEQKRLQTETESQISYKQTEVIEEDVQLPKILRKMNEKKKKAKPNAVQRKADSKIQYSQITNCQDQELVKQLQLIKLNAVNQKNNLLNSLQIQIKLDEQLRKAKKWFEKLKINNKWNILMSHLQKNQYSIPQHQMKNNFSLHSEQQNPFYNPQEGDFTIDECVKAYIVAECHWKYQIVHNFSPASLTASNFNEQNIDIGGKGYVNIQDLTRYINCQLDTFYRNRDVYLIYQRFRNSERLHYSAILNCLSYT